MFLFCISILFGIANLHAESAETYAPISHFHIERSGYCLNYDAKNKNPCWVCERLTAADLIGDADRSNFSFREDESLPEHLRAALADYRGSGFDRGHLAPAANHKCNDAAMDDTFYLTNMCPQRPQFNRGYWAKLEKHVRDLTKNYKTVYVISGPLYLPYTDADGKRYVKYQVIGSNDVAVPTHFFKVVFLEDSDGKVEAQAYILPNEGISSNVPFEKFKTTVKNVEKLAGMIFIKGAG